MAHIQTVIEDIQDKIGLLPGIKSAPDYVPDNEKPFPFVIAYEGPGYWKFGTTGEKQGMLTVKVELHVARKDMPRDVAQAVFYSDQIPNAIMSAVKDVMLSEGTIDGCGEIETTGLVFMQYYAPSGIGDHIGYIFTVKDIKIRSNIT